MGVSVGKPERSVDTTPDRRKHPNKDLGPQADTRDSVMASHKKLKDPRVKPERSVDTTQDTRKYPDKDLGPQADPRGSMMASHKKLKDPRVCRVFVSSPFGGYEGEREELVLKYFPMLSHRCQSKGVQFVAVDMRWGITEEAATNAQVVSICLREVDRSDIFVGFYGQRYGWHGAKDEQLQQNIDNATGRFPWLVKWRDRSVTEMEFLHGHLNKPGNLPAIFAFRDKKYDDEQKAEAEKVKDVRTAAKYAVESELSKKLVADLKNRVAKTKAKCLAYTENYSSPKTGAKFVFEEIQKHLDKLLVADDHHLDKRLVDLSIHTAFMASRTVVYVGGDVYVKTLDTCLEGGSRICIVGPSGCGKAAVISHWITKMKKARSSASLVYHFVACSSESADTHYLMNRLIKELNHICGDVQKSKKESIEEMSEDMKMSSLELSDTFRELELTLKKAAVKHKIVLVMEGIGKVNKLSRTAKSLFWLPVDLPPNVSVVVSCRDQETEIIDELMSRKYTQLTIQPLSQTEKQDMCKQRLSQHSKRLSSNQLTKIVDVKQTENPLFLTTVVSELTAFGEFETLDDKIDNLTTCKTVKDLFDVLLRRLEKDYVNPEQAANLIEQVTCSIWVSNSGLSEREITEMHKVPSHVWSPLYFAMQDYVVEMAGLIKFAFEDLRSAVEQRYLKDKITRLKYQNIVTHYFEEQRKNVTIISLDDPMLIRPAEELPKIYRQMGDKQKLTEVLSDVSIFSRIFMDQEFELINLWRETGLSGDEIANKYLESIMKRSKEIQDNVENREGLNEMMTLTLVSYLSALSFFFGMAAYKSAQEKILMAQSIFMERAMSYMSEPERIRNVTAIKHKLAHLYTSTGRLKEAAKLHEEVLTTRQRQVKEAKTKALKDSLLKGLGSSYHGVAMLHSKMGNIHSAIDHYTKAMEVQKQLNNEADVADSLHNLGVMYMKLGKHTDALDMMQKSLKIYEDVYFANLPPVIGVMIGNIAVCQRNLGQVDEAAKMYERAIAINETAVGEQHPYVAQALVNLGTLETNRGQLDKAEGYLRRANEIYKKTESSSTLHDYYRCLEKFVYVLILNKKLDEAYKNFEIIYAIATKEKLMDDCWPNVYLSMASCLAGSKNYPRALEIIRVAMSKPNCPDRAVAVYEDICKHMNIKPEQQHSTESAYNKNPGSLDLLQRHMTSNLIPKGKVEPILECLEKTDKIKNFGPALYETAIVWCQESKQKNLVEGILQVAAPKFPGEVSFSTGWAKVVYERGQFKEVIEYCKRLVKMEPSNPSHFVMLGDAALRIPDLELAKMTFKEITSKYGQNKNLAGQANKALEMIAAVERRSEK